MSVKKSTKTANICANLYEGEFDINFDCVGVEQCMFALCFMMPPDGNDPCSFNHHGSCINIAAQIKSLALLKNRLTKELAQREEAEESA